MITVKIPHSNTEIGELKPIVRVIDEHGGDKLYIMFIADCFDPALYLVLGNSAEDAFENFVCDDKIEEFLKVSPADAADYGDEDDWEFNENGTHIDPENVMCIGPITWQDVIDARDAA